MKQNVIFMTLLFLLPSFFESNSFGQSIKDETLLNKTKEALEFCKKNNFNTDLCLLFDMGIHSGKNRVFAVDLKNDSIIKSGLSSHGCGSSNWGVDKTKENPQFSNVSESHCTSLGKYRIGKKGYSNWGIHINYKIHGLEKSNNNAYKRHILLHSWDKVSDKEIFPKGTVESWGCPAVSNEMMRFLNYKLKDSKKSILLWIYYEKPK